ncbi:MULTISPECIES: nuclear transport factor 2 family protein [Nocardioides]|uniref:Nuclear transport factor 2 family protein n=1 Tax=Nocardioides vastitatis TaxID=2568655 RepID=A0ABW0ZGB1_9ACTN|nr:nuclear transport factor 2 family protein [Nocardioides sp.]
MTAVHERSILLRAYDDEQAEVERALERILSAARRKAVDELESLHAFGPKFTKYDDFEPLGRQDADTTKRLEREAITGVKAFVPDVEDVKIDVFGPVAVATFVMNYDVVTEEDERLSFRARSTMVFARDEGRWLIVHEHFSPFTSNG